MKIRRNEQKVTAVEFAILAFFLLSFLGFIVCAACALSLIHI